MNVCKVPWDTWTKSDTGVPGAVITLLFKYTNSIVLCLLIDISKTPPKTLFIIKRQLKGYLMINALSPIMLTDY